MSPTLDRWLDTIKVALTTLAVGWAMAAATGDAAVVAGAVAGGVIGAWVVSPWSRVGRHTPHARAVANASGQGDVVVYWRPGCTVAVSLLASLTPAERDAATWVNVVRDPDAAAFVREHRDGDMVTPTAVTGAGRLVPATAEDLRPLLAPA